MKTLAEAEILLLGKPLSQRHLNVAIEAVPPIIQFPGVEKVIFFGSGAKGEAGLGSDTDVCVVAQDSEALGLNFGIIAYLDGLNFFPGTPTGLDACVVSSSTFADPNNEFYQEVQETGILLWPYQ